MQSQNHKMVDFERDLCEVESDQKLLVSTLVLKEGHLGPVARICVQKALGHVWGGSLTTSVDNLY